MPKKIKKAKKARKAKKVGTKLITMDSPVNPGAQIIVATELMDDAMLETELTKSALPYYIYQFCDEKPRCKPPMICPASHKKITGLSSKGVNEIVRRANQNPRSGMKIRLRPEYQKVERDVAQDGVNGVEVSVFAEDMITGASAWGIKFEPYMKTGRNGQYKNEFALEKALSKAERNARRKLIPEMVAVKAILLIMQKEPEKVLLVAPPPAYQTITAAPRKPVPTTPEEAEANILRWVERTKTSDALIRGLDTLNASTAYTAAFKKKVSDLISAKVDALENK